jgi:hypothetical protein
MWLVAGLANDPDLIAPLRGCVARSRVYHHSFPAQLASIPTASSIMVLRITQSEKSPYVHIKSAQERPLTLFTHQNKPPASATMSANNKSLPAEGLSPSAAGTTGQEQVRSELAFRSFFKSHYLRLTFFVSSRMDSLQMPTANSPQQ